MDLSRFTKAEKLSVLRSDPNDPWTWSLWDNLGFMAFGTPYHNAYRELYARLQEEIPPPPAKHRADGVCGVCGSPVPETNPNLFYCSESCRKTAWHRHNPLENL